MDPERLEEMTRATVEKAQSDFTRRAYSTDLEEALRRIVCD
jgi:hypothetical protein